MIDPSFVRACKGLHGCMAVREPREPHGVQSALHMLMLKRMLLLRAGDVELNPGPEDDGNL